MVRAGPAPVPRLPRVIAIDEWAWRRGRRYGTIIVDLERNAIAELLPDRDANTVADWLRRHPSVEIVARDRAEVYGEGVRQGAPGAVHVLDRWHVLRNLGEAAQEAVTGQHSVIRSVARTLGDERAAALRAEMSRVRPLTSADRRKQGSTPPVMRATPNSGAFVQPVLPSPALRAISISTARPYGVGCGGTNPDLEKAGAPECHRSPPRLSRPALGRGAAVMGPSWPANSTGSAPGSSRASFGRGPRRGVGPGGRLDHETAGASYPWRPPGTQRIVRLLQSGVDAGNGEDGAFIERLRCQAPGLADAADLAARLAAMLRGHSAEAVEDWLAAARSSALKRFAASLQRDIGGLANAIALPVVGLARPRARSAD